ncbi:MAG: M23 family metallopeptidase [Solirubrobacterales bacterium]
MRLPKIRPPKVRMPKVSRPRPRRRRIVDPEVRAHRRELLRGTAKAGAALFAVGVVAVGVGAVLGLPLPTSASSDGELPSEASGILVPIDQGTASGISSQGPFHPLLAAKVDYGEVAARFGGGRSHPGQDLFAAVGTPLVAVRPGTVVDWGTVKGAYSGGRGNYIGIHSPLDGRTYNYLHMKVPSPLRVGDTVAAGQVVGHLGCTGSCDGPHLHFEIRAGKDDFGHDRKPIDPLPIIRHWPEAPLPGQL